jgi:site-specific recombinase XerD
MKKTNTQKMTVSGHSEELKNKVKSFGKTDLDILRMKLMERRVKQKRESDPVFNNSILFKGVIDNEVEKSKHDLLVSKVDIGKEVTCFIEYQHSEKTKTNYMCSLRKFFGWTDMEKIDPRKITRIEGESYLNYLTHTLGLSSNSIRTNMGCLMGFYNYMMIRNPKLFTVSPFYNIKIPKSELVRRIDYVSKNDIDELKKKLKKIDRKDCLVAIDLMTKYGFRIGSFQNMTVDKKTGKYKTVSKGSDLTGKFTMTEVKQILGSGLLNKKPNTLTRVTQKYTQKLYDDGKISCPFSPHDLRHYCITEKLRRCDSVEDVMRVSRLYHKHPSTTLSYWREIHE